MNKLNEIIEKQTFEKNKLYLLLKPSLEYGFFYQNGIVYFAAKSTSGSAKESVQTAYLDMNLGVYITSDSEQCSFETGNYDMLAFKDRLDSPEFDVFFNICCSYSQSPAEMEFSEFFSSLVELFKKTKEGSQKNLIGLIGELIFIKRLNDDYGINVSENWHLSGSNGKFDFSFPQFNIEIKTSTNGNMTFLLKHEQIFNNQKNYICVISIIETGEGDSLKTLVEYFSNNDPFKNNVKFQIAIQRELLKVTEKKDKERKFVLDTIDVFDCSKLKTIGQIPGCIGNIQYEYNFSEVDSVDLANLFEAEQC